MSRTYKDMKKYIDKKMRRLYVSKPPRPFYNKKHCDLPLYILRGDALYERRIVNFLESLPLGKFTLTQRQQEEFYSLFNFAPFIYHEEELICNVEVTWREPNEIFEKMVSVFHGVDDISLVNKVFTLSFDLYVPDDNNNDPSSYSERRLTHGVNVKQLGKQLFDKQVNK